MKWENDSFYITDSGENIDIDFVVNSLQQSYWAADRSEELIVKSIENSVLLSLFDNHKQNGFARIIGDGATFAYICDVFVSEQYRGRGLGRFLMQCVLEHPMTKVRSNYLGTKDAHGLYEKFGFSRCECMSRKNNPLFMED